MFGYYHTKNAKWSKGQINGCMTCPARQICSAPENNENPLTAALNISICHEDKQSTYDSLDLLGDLLFSRVQQNNGNVYEYSHSINMDLHLGCRDLQNINLFFDTNTGQRRERCKIFSRFDFVKPKSKIGGVLVELLENLLFVLPDIDRNIVQYNLDLIGKVDNEATNNENLNSVEFNSVIKNCRKFLEKVTDQIVSMDSRMIAKIQSRIMKEFGEIILNFLPSEKYAQNIINFRNRSV